MNRLFIPASLRGRLVVSVSAGVRLLSQATCTGMALRVSLIRFRLVVSVSAGVRLLTQATCTGMALRVSLIRLLLSR